MLSGTKNSPRNFRGRVVYQGAPWITVRFTVLWKLFFGITSKGLSRTGFFLDLAMPCHLFPASRGHRSFQTPSICPPCSSQSIYPKQDRWLFFPISFEYLHPMSWLFPIKYFWMHFTCWQKNRGAPFPSFINNACNHWPTTALPFMPVAIRWRHWTGRKQICWNWQRLSRLAQMTWCNCKKRAFPTSAGNDHLQLLLTCIVTDDQSLYVQFDIWLK